MQSAPSFDTLEPKIQAHLDALGFHSVGSYRIWCHKQGLDKGLSKSDAQIAEEGALFRRLQEEAKPPPEKGHRPGTARSITKAYKSRHGVAIDLDAMFQATADQAERDALHRLLIHLEKYTRIPFEVGARLARHHRAWVRPPENWFPSSRQKMDQLGGLANHLLAKYDVPLFMGHAWLDDDNTSKRGQRWFLHIGKGGSIRNLECDIHLTRRMAHQFRKAPTNLPLPMAVRWAQCVGMGGSRSLAYEIVRSRLRHFLKNEPFWAAVVRFFVSHPLLEPSHVGPVVDYIYNQKFVPRETETPDGQVIHDPPPQPNLVMKGRSVDKLLREVATWHSEMAHRDSVTWVEWPGSRIDGYSIKERDTATGLDLTWRIVELRNSHDLTREGSLMHHCIYSYRDRCESGDFSVFSVQVEVPAGGWQHILTLAVDNDERVVTEFRGKYNLRPYERKALGKKGDLQLDLNYS